MLTHTAKYLLQSGTQYRIEFDRSSSNKSGREGIIYADIMHNIRVKTLVKRYYILLLLLLCVPVARVVYKSDRQEKNKKNK